MRSLRPRWDKTKHPDLKFTSYCRTARGRGELLLKRQALALRPKSRRRLPGFDQSAVAFSQFAMRSDTRRACGVRRAHQLNLSSMEKVIKVHKEAPLLASGSTGRLSARRMLTEVASPNSSFIAFADEPVLAAVFFGLSPQNSLLRRGNVRHPLWQGTFLDPAQFEGLIVEDERIVAVGLLTRSELEALGPTFTRAWPIDEATAFDELIAAIDEADSKRRTEHNVEYPQPETSFPSRRS